MSCCYCYLSVCYILLHFNPVEFVPLCLFLFIKSINCISFEIMDMTVYCCSKFQTLFSFDKIDRWLLIVTFFLTAF